MSLQSGTIANGIHPAFDETTGRNRTRVLHLINNFDIGGTERQAVRLLPRLDERRFDIRLAAIRKRGPLYAEIASRFPEVPEFPLTSFYNANAMRQLSRLRALLRRERIDILHAWDFYADLIGVAAARLSGVRVIASQRHLRLSHRPVHLRGQKIIHRLADRILVNSEAIRDHILSLGTAAPEKIVVVKNGLSAADEVMESGASAKERRAEIRASARAALAAELGLNREAKLVGVVAKLRPRKGHDCLIEAAARLWREGLRAHFVLVGDGPLRGEIETGIARLGLGGRVHLLGDRLDVAQLLPAFDLAVLPSTGDEGLPNAVLEAMAAGLPVVASRVRGVTELIEDGETGYLVPAGDVEALARRMADLLGGEMGVESVAARGREFVLSRFGMPVMVEAIERLYDELMDAS